MKLEQARQFALSLPEVTEEPHFAYTSFRIRGKIFATAPPEGKLLHVFVDEEIRAPLISAEPKVFEPLPWGAKIIGIRIHLARAKVASVERLLLQGWMRKAPKSLIGAVS